MNRKLFHVVGAVVVLIALLLIIVGQYLVTPMAEAQERGTIAGWWLVWIVIGVTVISAGALAAFLFAAGLGKVPETRA